jgi:hypothetical protein
VVKKPKKPTKKLQVKDLDAKKNPRGGTIPGESADKSSPKLAL